MPGQENEIQMVDEARDQNTWPKPAASSCAKQKLVTVHMVNLVEHVGATSEHTPRNTKTDLDGIRRS